MKIKILILCLCSVGLFAQEIPEQVVRGVLTDAVSGEPLVGASVLLPGTVPVKGTTTDEKGKYRLEDVPVGRYNLEATYLGYELLIVPAILVESGKELILNLSLYEQVESLGEVLVRSNRKQGQAISPVSLQTITVEEVLRYPATFNDPARLAASYPGVVNTNDQANHISVRGNSPNSTSWRLEGVEIVNPNHLGDAGTSSNRPSVSGGGVNILSAQLLGTTNFYTSAFPTEYGNAIGGIMDMNFRNGNDEKHEFIGQAGLVGFDFSAEGPISKDKGISYLINYRYSFVGLLTAMGVDFGGEAISFQDLAFNVKAPLGKNGVLKVFGMGGISENIFTGKLDSADWEVDKDRYNISFTNRMGALGASYSNRFSAKTRFKISLVSSGVRTNKRSDLIGLNASGEITPSWNYDSLFHRKIAAYAKLSYKLNKNHQLQFASSGVHHLYDINTLNFLDRSVGNEGGLLLGNSAMWVWNPTNTIQLQAGVHHAFFTLTESSSIEPRSSLRWEATSNDRFSIAYGLHSQLQPGQIYFAAGSTNEKLDFSKSHHLVFNYTRKLGFFSELSLEAYYQSLFNIPVDKTSGLVGNYSAINLLSDFENRTLVNEGTGRNYGVELNWNRQLKDDYFILTNASLFQSKYDGLAGEERNTRYNSQYLFNLTIGKEFSWQKNGKQKILGINTRATYVGGLWRSEIDEVASAETFLVTIRDQSNPFNAQQNDYFKADFRVYLKNNKSKYNTTLALDLQNATNRKNDGYYYYDHLQGEVLSEKQLGLIPNLSYRIEF